jgi:outer membrane protein assembly factor BamB
MPTSLNPEMSVIVQTALGMVLCLDARSGELIWSLNLL